MFNETLEISVLLLMFLVEALVAALVAVALLFVLNRAKKVLVEKLMARLSELDNDPEAIELEADEFSEADTALVNAETEQHEQNYQQYLEDALLYTKDYHQLCFNTDKITLDKDESVDQQIIALRHNFLFAEKTLTQYDQTTPEFWQQLKNRLRRIIKAYEPDEEDDDEDTVAPVDNSEELARLEAENENLKKRVSNLEMFKKMFFDLQIKVKELTEQGQEIHNQATSIAEANDDGDMLGLLNQYQNSYQEMSAAASNTPPVIQVTQAAGEGVTQVMHVKDTKELNQLKETNSDQHNIITRLRGELQGMQNASSDEINNKTAEIEQQIAKMEKSLAESDMCVQMLENDYSDAMQQVYELEEKLNTQQAETNQLVDTMTMVQNESSTQTETILALQAENASLTSAAEAGNNAQQMIQNFAKESQELMGCMATLEDENDLMTKQVKRLKIKLKKQRNSKASSAAPSTDDANLKAKISEKDKEIMRLQTEYSELEAQYLDAFTKLNS